MDYINTMKRIDVLKNHYEPRLEKFRDNAAILDWENADAQYKRFRAMTDNIDLHAKIHTGCRMRMRRSVRTFKRETAGT